MGWESLTRPSWPIAPSLHSTPSGSLALQSMCRSPLEILLWWVTLTSGTTSHNSSKGYNKQLHSPIHRKTQHQVLDSWLAHKGARHSSPRVQPGTHVAILAPMGLEKPSNACEVPLSSMAESSPPSVLMKSQLELAAGYYLWFCIQALTKCLLLLAAV